MADGKGQQWIRSSRFEARDLQYHRLSLLSTPLTTFTMQFKIALALLGAAVIPTVYSAAISHVNAVSSPLLRSSMPF